MLFCDNLFRKLVDKFVEEFTLQLVVEEVDQSGFREFFEDFGDFVRIEFSSFFNVFAFDFHSLSFVACFECHKSIHGFLDALEHAWLGDLTVLDQ